MYLVLFIFISIAIYAYAIYLIIKSISKLIHSSRQNGVDKNKLIPKKNISALLNEEIETNIAKFVESYITQEQLVKPNQDFYSKRLREGIEDLWCFLNDTYNLDISKSDLIRKISIVFDEINYSKFKAEILLTIGLQENELIESNYLFYLNVYIVRFYFHRDDDKCYDVYMKRFINELFPNLDIDFRQTISDLRNQLDIKIRSSRMEKVLSSGIAIEYCTIEDIDNSSADGIDFELFVADLFRQMGYRCETTKRTGDMGADIIAEKIGEKIAIQCKRSRNSISPNAVQEVFTSIQYYSCDKSIVITNSELTSGAKELAKVNNIEIIERSQLESLMKKFPVKKDVLSSRHPTNIANNM